MKGHVAGAGDSPVNLSLTMMIYKSFKIGPLVSHTCLPVGDASSSFSFVDMKKVYNQRYFVKATHIFFIFFLFPQILFYFILLRKNESLLIIPLIKSTKFL